MTLSQIELVQSSFRHVLLISESTAQLFYARLFATQPALRALFPVEMRSQQKKFMYTLGAVVAYLKKPIAVAPALEALAQRHAGYGATPEHYQAVGDALLWALGQGLGETFTEETRLAWLAFYEDLASLMQHAGRAPAEPCPR